jgi:pimeloyl-ACP methyl ester carboxylesterase
VTRVLYLHGIASGPDSPKGLAVDEHLTRHGFSVERLDLRLPTPEERQVSAMIAHVRERIGAHDRVVLMGASLGALTALRVAETDERVAALVLLAPALASAERWHQKLGPSAVADWRASGFMLADFPGGRKGRLHYDFLRDLDELDRADRGMPQLRAPALVIHGVRDSVVEIGLARAWTSERRPTRYVEVDDDHELKSSLPLILEETTSFLAALG